MNSPVVHFILRYSTVFARLAVGAVFLSNVADRLGLWGPPGTGSVAWGNLDNYYDSVRALNPYLPEVLVPVVGWFVNIAEIVLGLLLIVGFKTRWAGLLSGLLLITFALANAVNFGIKVPLNYSIFSAAAAALLIASHRKFPFSIDHVMTKPPQQHHVATILVFVSVGLLAGCAENQDATSAQPSPTTGERTADSTCNLVGAWEPVSLRFTDPDGTVRDVEIGDPPGLKILSESHWVFVEEGSGEQGPTSGGGGTYMVEGSTYTEHVDYHGATSFVGEDIAFDCRTDDGRWYQSGELPDGTYLEEVYRRLE